MKKFITVLGFVVLSFFGFHQQVFAQGQPEFITPTVYCLGSCPTNPPSDPDNPPSDGDPIPPPADDDTDPGDGNPCTDAQSTVQNADGQVVAQYDKERPRSRGGFFQRFFQALFDFILRLIELILGGVPGAPNIPDNPSNPNDPNPSAPTPCPEPTSGTSPSVNPEPTTNNEVSPTIYVQPSVAPSISAGTMPAITVSGNNIQRGGQDWWFIGYNSFVWSADCGHPEEKMSAADVDAWFASMRHDGHGAVRLFFYSGWDIDRLDAAVASAKKHNIYLLITLDDAIGGCGENDKDAGWFDNDSERSTFKAHMSNLLTRYKGETAIFAFEYFNEPDYEDGRLRQFYDEMGAHAATIDPNRLFSSGTVAPYWVGGEDNFKDISSSPGVDIVSLHEYDQDEIESNHGPKVRANSAGKPVIAGEFGIDSSQSGSGCKTDFTERARRFTEKAKVYTGDGYVGGFAWAWQPGNGGGACEYGNIDADEPTQNAFRTLAR